MKKSITPLLALTAACVATLTVSCGSYGEQSVTGIITEASMNTIDITTPQGETLAFSTVDADRSDVNGIALGDTATLFYTGELETGTGITSATKIEVSPVTSPIAGAWVEPIPGQDGVQGIKFENNGTASSINTATLIYNSWFMDADNLILSGVSIGNGQNIDFMDTVKIVKLTSDSLILDRRGYISRYSKHIPTDSN